MQSLRTKAAGLALGLILVGLAPGVSRADMVLGQPIYAQNNTGRTIYVAATYVPAGSSSYVSDGFWRVDPEQRQLILYNNARYIYFYARDAQGLVWSGSDTTSTVRGEYLNMFRSDTGTGYQPWTMSFNPY
jgi:uncharacterized membrane protein